MVRTRNLDPATWPDECFRLYSVPAFDVGIPDLVAGRQIGSAKQVVQPDDVLLSRIIPHIRRAWMVDGQASTRAIASGEWIVFRSPQVVPAYLRHLLVSDQVHQKLMATVAGVGGSLLRMRPAHVAKIRIPLPPLDEQRGIAHILDRKDVLLTKRRAAMTQLDDLADSVFADMFGDPVANPRGWPNPTLGELLRFQQYGPRFHNATYAAEGTRIIRITDLNDAGDLEFSQMPRLTVTSEDRSKYALQPGDLIFARSGATIGKVALISPDAPTCIAGAYFIAMRFDPAIEPRYVKAVLTSPSVRAIVATQSRQSAQQNFSGPALRRLPMPLPPTDLQRRFVDRMVAIDRLRKACRASESGLEALSGALQARAFRKSE